MDIEMKAVIPNIMIFRSEDGDFVEYDLDESFNMTGEPRYFHVLPEDNYNTMRDDHIVVAEKISEEIGRLPGIVPCNGFIITHTCFEL